RDAWLENPLHFYLTPLHKILHHRLEQRVLRHANHIISINRPIKERIVTEYDFLSHNDVTIISQGYDQADFEGVQRQRGRDGRLRILYAGTFYYNRNPRAFFTALRSLAESAPAIARSIDVHIVGSKRDEDAAMLREFGLEASVTLHGYLPHRDTIQHLVDADVLLLVIGHGKGEDMMSTGKLYEYLGARKPVLACVPDGAARQVLAKGGAAFVADPDDPEAIAVQIRALFELHKNDRLPTPSYEYVSQFDRKMLTGRLAALFSAALEPGPPVMRVRNSASAHTGEDPATIPKSTDAS
ncbi:MAG: glycosyltransferase, partial [Bacteroidota bacterium]